MGTKHWRITRFKGVPDAIVAADPDLGSVPICKIVLGTEHEEHAKLIAAAPELLEALQAYMAASATMLGAMEDGRNVHGALSSFTAADELAREAIARATS